MKKRSGAVLAVGVVAAAIASQLAGSGLAQTEKPATAALMQAMESMMSHMHMQLSGDADKDFATLMVPHHQAAIDMAKAELAYGKDPDLRALAQRIIDAQEREIRTLNDWLIISQADDHH